MVRTWGRLQLLYFLLYDVAGRKRKPHEDWVFDFSESRLPKLRVAGSRPVSRSANFSVKKPLSANAEVSTKPGQLQAAYVAVVDAMRHGGQPSSLPKIDLVHDDDRPHIVTRVIVLVSNHVEAG